MKDALDGWCLVFRRCLGVMGCGGQAETTVGQQLTMLGNNGLLLGHWWLQKTPLKQSL